MNEFVIESASLANRVISYFNTFCVFIKHPFFGVGIGNLANVMLQQTLSSSVPLTEETISNIIKSVTSNVPFVYNGGYIYVFLAENGIFITGCYLYFWLKTYFQLLKLNRNVLSKMDNSFEYHVNKGLQGCILGLFILFFYDYSFTNIELYIILVLSILLIYKYKNIKISYKKDSLDE